jgi:hypothetical protein
MNILFIGIWVTVLDYNTNPKVIILAGIGNFPEIHVLFLGMWMTWSDDNTNPIVIILVGIGILPKCMFYLLVSG